jgi:murein DD-endopeptidase MepM/ murein hydrolase activator NlpD
MGGRGFCQDGPVLPQRSLASTLLTLALTTTVALAGCGAPPDAAGDDPAWVATPLPETTEPSQAPSPTPSATATPSPSVKPSAPKKAPKPSVKPSVPVGKAPTKRPVSTYVFPVSASNVAWHKTHGKYPATDIFADCGKPILAVTGGVVLEVSLKDTFVKGRPDGPANGGLSVSLLGDDGVRYYGSHLSKVQSGIKAGVRVTAGQKLGLLGKTGNANNVCHLHFGLSPKCAGTGDWKVRRGVVWPYSYLSSWRSKGSKSPAAAVSDWKKARNCKA